MTILLIILRLLEFVGEEGNRRYQVNNAQLDTEVINALIKVTKNIKHINYNRWESNFKAKETVAIR